MPAAKKPKTRVAPARKRPVLSKLSLRKARLIKYQNPNLRIWQRIRRTSFLPDGTPFKVSGADRVRLRSGVSTTGFNQPIILVSDLLNAAERREVARHELNEWKVSRYRGMKSYSDPRSCLAAKTEGHEWAKKRDNPRLKRSVTAKERKYRKGLSPKKVIHLVSNGTY